MRTSENFPFYMPKNLRADWLFCLEKYGAWSKSKMEREFSRLYQNVNFGPESYFILEHGCKNQDEIQRCRSVLKRHVEAFRWVIFEAELHEKIEKNRSNIARAKIEVFGFGNSRLRHTKKFHEGKAAWKLHQKCRKILDVWPHDSFETVKKTWKAKSVAAHPDRGGSKSKQQKINWAFSILKKSYYKK